MGWKPSIFQNGRCNCRTCFEELLLVRTFYREIVSRARVYLRVFSCNGIFRVIRERFELAFQNFRTRGFRMAEAERVHCLLRATSFATWLPMIARDFCTLLHARGPRKDRIARQSLSRGLRFFLTLSPSEDVRDFRDFLL